MYSTFLFKTRDIPDSQNAVKNEGHPQTDVDIQRVPTTPYIEQYSSSPSLYSINDTPLQATVPWMSAPSFGNQYRDQGHGGSQRLAAVMIVHLQMLCSPYKDIPF